MRLSIESTGDLVSVRGVDQASAVKCSIEDYAEGLEAVREHVDAALAAANEDIENADRGDVEPLDGGPE